MPKLFSTFALNKFCPIDDFCMCRRTATMAFVLRPFVGSHKVYYDRCVFVFYQARYKKDCQLAVELLQCTPSGAYMQHKVSQVRVLAKRDSCW